MNFEILFVLIGLIGMLVALIMDKMRPGIVLLSLVVVFMAAETNGGRLQQPGHDYGGLAFSGERRHPPKRCIGDRDKEAPSRTENDGDASPASPASGGECGFSLP